MLGYDGLRVRGAPSVALQYPAGLKFREHALQMRDAEIAEFGVAHLVERIAFRQVFRQIHNVPPAIGAGGFKIGVLNHTHEGEAWVIDIEPIGA